MVCEKKWNGKKMRLKKEWKMWKPFEQSEWRPKAFWQKGLEQHKIQVLLLQVYDRVNHAYTERE